MLGDPEYDRLYRELQDLEREFPQLVTSGFPDPARGGAAVGRVPSRAARGPPDELGQHVLGAGVARVCASGCGSSCRASRSLGWWSRRWMDWRSICAMRAGRWFAARPGETARPATISRRTSRRSAACPCGSTREAAGQGRIRRRFRELCPRFWRSAARSTCRRRGSRSSTPAAGPRGRNRLPIPETRLPARSRCWIRAWWRLAPWTLSLYGLGEVRWGDGEAAGPRAAHPKGGAGLARGPRVQDLGAHLGVRGRRRLGGRDRRTRRPPARASVTRPTARW